MQHLDEGTIHAWLDDALPGPEREAVAEHVAHCPQCAAAVADARGMIAGASRILSALDDVPGGVLPRAAEGKPKRSTWRALHVTPARAALAASLMVAVAGALAVRYQRSENIGTAPAAAPAVAAPSSAPSATASSAPPPAATPSPAPHTRQQPAQTAPPKTSKRAASAIAQARPESPVAVTATSATGATSATSAAAANMVAGGVPTAKPRSISADSVASAAPAAPAMAAMRSAARRVEPAFADASMQPRFSGCYEISNDSALRSFRIASRFALQRAAPLARGGAMRYPVVALTSDGRVDSLATSGTWRAVDDTTAAVSWMLDSTPTTLTIHFIHSTAPQMTGELATPTRTIPVNVARIDCHY